MENIFDLLTLKEEDVLNKYHMWTYLISDINNEVYLDSTSSCSGGGCGSCKGCAANFAVFLF